MRSIHTPALGPTQCLQYRIYVSLTVVSVAPPAPNHPLPTQTKNRGAIQEVPTKNAAGKSYSVTGTIQQVICWREGGGPLVDHRQRQQQQEGFLVCTLCLCVQCSFESSRPHQMCWYHLPPLNSMLLLVFCCCCPAPVPFPAHHLLC